MYRKRGARPRDLRRMARTISDGESKGRALKPCPKGGKKMEKSKVLQWTESLNTYDFEFLTAGLYQLASEWTRQAESEVNARLDVLNAPTDITAVDVFAWWFS